MPTKTAPKTRKIAKKQAKPWLERAGFMSGTDHDPAYITGTFLARRVRTIQQTLRCSTVNARVADSSELGARMGGDYHIPSSPFGEWYSQNVEFLVGVGSFSWSAALDDHCSLGGRAGMNVGSALMTRTTSRSHPEPSQFWSQESGPPGLPCTSNPLLPFRLRQLVKRAFAVGHNLLKNANSVQACCENTCMQQATCGRPTQRNRTLTDPRAAVGPPLLGPRSACVRYREKQDRPPRTDLPIRISVVVRI